MAPRSSGAVGTSRQPRTVRPSSAAIVSIRETASVAVSSGRKAIPTAYEPASGSSNSATSRKKVSGTCERIPAPSPESGSEPVAPRCSRLRSTVSACSTSAWLASPVRVATKPTPQASCSLRGSYIPCAAGRASMKDQFWPFAECWDGWRGVRIGSPVVVVAYASAEGRRWPSAKGAKFRAGYMMEPFSGTGYGVPTCGRRGSRRRPLVAAEQGDLFGQINDRRPDRGRQRRPTLQLLCRRHCPQRLRLMPSG